MLQRSVKQAGRSWSTACSETPPSASYPTLSEEEDSKDEIQFIAEANLTS
jgi:hypothetical protein